MLINKIELFSDTLKSALIQLNKTRKYKFFTV